MNPLRRFFTRRIPLVEPIQGDPFRRWDRMARNDVSSLEDVK